jgi:hypothetical protein
MTSAASFGSNLSSFSSLAWRRVATQPTTHPPPHPPTHLPNQLPTQPTNPPPPGKLVFVSHAVSLTDKDTLASFFGLEPTELPALVGFEAAKNRKFRLELEDGEQLT